jgi:ADP-ribosyl-[dinitrogen reductase] hydrolase
MEEEAASLTGCLLGTAVGDALGLPYEGLSPSRAKRMFGAPTRYRLLFGYGMVSDDTEHACLTLQAFRDSRGDVERFRNSLARRMRWWLMGLPAGIGLATLRSILRLWAGVSPERSGVFSAGNGAAMRAGVLGVAVDDLFQLRRFVLASTLITHCDPRAFHGALAVGLAAHYSARVEQVAPAEYLANFSQLCGEEGEEMAGLLARSVASAANGESTEDFAKALGLSRGVSGFVNHTVPVVIQAWLRNLGDYCAAVQAVIRCGGDADTTAALVGGIVGAAVGRQGISSAWLERLCERPRTTAWLERLAVSQTPIELPWILQAGRNLFFLLVVLAHGFRRLAPPY